MALKLALGNLTIMPACLQVVRVTMWVVDVAKDDLCTSGVENLWHHHQGQHKFKTNQ